VRVYVRAYVRVLRALVHVNLRVTLSYVLGQLTQNSDNLLNADSMHFSCDSCPCIIYLETKPYTVRVFVVSSMAVNLLHTVTCLAIKIDQELTSANHMRSLAC